MEKAIYLTNIKNENLGDTSTDFEVVEVSSEGSALTPLREYALKIESEVKSILSLKLKDFSYKILVIGNEYKDGSFTKEKIFILTDTTEGLSYVMDSLTEKNLVYYGEIQDNKSKEEYSSVKIKAQFWCDQIYRFLANEFNFNGLVRIKAATFCDIIEMFNISVSGKGVNDLLVSKMRELSEKIKTNPVIFNLYEENDIYIALSDLLKS